MDKYLKSKQYYIDLYDRLTVDRCRRWEKLCLVGDKPLVYKGKKINKKVSSHFKKFLFEITLWFKKGEEYELKEETIRKWMDKDEALDDLMESAHAPEDIRCLTCYTFMDVDNKTFHTDSDNKKERVLFMYKCPKGHFPMRLFFADGEEYRIKPKLCPKCQTVLDANHKKNGKHKITVSESCPSCGYLNVEEMDFTIKEKAIDNNFGKDRARFCFTEKEGQEYADYKINAGGFQQILDEQKERERNKDIYDKIAKLQKLTVVELEKLLAPVLEKASYIKLQFGQPDIGKDFFLPFTVYDAKSERIDQASTHELEKLLRKILDDTNWRLMSDGVSYRMGMLSGRLRAYETEEDLFELIRLKEKKLSKASKL